MNGWVKIYKSVDVVNCECKFKFELQNPFLMEKSVGNGESVTTALASLSRKAYVLMVAHCLAAYPKAEQISAHTHF